MFYLLLIFSLCFTISIGLWTTFFDVGYFFKWYSGLIGLFSNIPPQFGQTWSKTFSTQSWQNVHSKVQIIASWLSKASNLLQCSQVGLISSILVDMLSLLMVFLDGPGKFILFKKITLLKDKKIESSNLTKISMLKRLNFYNLAILV